MKIKAYVLFKLIVNANYEVFISFVRAYEPNGTLKYISMLLLEIILSTDYVTFISIGRACRTHQRYSQ